MSNMSSMGLKSGENSFINQEEGVKTQMTKEQIEKKDQERIEKIKK